MLLRVSGAATSASGERRQCARHVDGLVAQALLERELGDVRIPRGMVSRMARYPARHGTPHGTVSSTARWRDFRLSQGVAAAFRTRIGRSYRRSLRHYVVAVTLHSFGACTTALVFRAVIGHCCPNAGAACVHTHAHTHAHTHTDTHTHTCRHTYIYIYIHSSILPQPQP
jgi:hypothetical protein